MTARSSTGIDPGETEATSPVTVAELRETIARLRESEHRLRLVTDHAPVAIACVDTKARYTFVNRHLAERQGVTPEEIIGRPVPEVASRAFAALEPYFRECFAGKAVEFEMAVPGRSGQTCILQARLAPQWSNGSVVGLVLASTDVTRIKHAEAALRDSEAAFRAMFEVSSVAQVEFDPVTGRFLRANPAMCRLLGYPEAELLTLTMFDVTHPDERGRDRELLHDLAAASSAVFDIDKRYVRKDGDTVWTHTTVNAVRDDAGRALRNTAAVLDISDCKRHEQRERVLLREVNHRSRNMLSVVQAIAQNTAARNSTDFLARFSARVQALSANQDLLVRNGWRGVDIGDLVRVQMAQFAPLLGSRITAHGPKLRLSPASSQAIGLALHELAVNAGEHGALSTADGNVDVAWRIDGDAFTMSWIECNGPTVCPPHARGFGTTIMEATVQRTVGGPVNLDYTPSGVIWRLNCPVANVRESPDTDFGDRKF